MTPALALKAPKRGGVKTFVKLLDLSEEWEHTTVSREAPSELATQAFPRFIRHLRGGFPSPSQPDPRIGAGLQ